MTAMEVEQRTIHTLLGLSSFQALILVSMKRFVMTLLSSDDISGFIADSTRHTSHQSLWCHFLLISADIHSSDLVAKLSSNAEKFDLFPTNKVPP